MTVLVFVNASVLMAVVNYSFFDRLFFGDFFGDFWGLLGTFGGTSGGIWNRRSGHVPDLRMFTLVNVFIKEHRA